MKPDTILIFDFGGQYCHLIGRRIRDNNVYSEIVPHDTSLKEIEDLKERFNVKGIILSGGPSSVYEKNSPKMSRYVLKLAIPILGICYAHQLIAYYMGGKVEQGKKREYGISFATIDSAADILKGLNKKEKVWMNHSDLFLVFQMILKSWPIPTIVPWLLSDISKNLSMVFNGIQKLRILKMEISY